MTTIEKFQKQTNIMIVKATLTIIDRRSGAVGTKEFYRFGQRFPIEMVEKELGKYGYDVLGYSAEDYVEGIIDYEKMFEYIQSGAEA